MAVPVYLDEETVKLLERGISALERFVESYEASVASQARMVDATVQTMQLTRALAEEMK